MSKQGKDSAKVIKFMRLFAKLKDWSDDDPEGLFDFAAGDESVRGLCLQLAFAAQLLGADERRARVLFAAPVDPAFLAAWRDYEDRYRSTVARIFLSGFPPDLVSVDPSGVRMTDLLWENADDEASKQDGAIEEAIEFARSHAEHEDKWGDQDFAAGIQDGIAVWERLRNDAGFDLRGGVAATRARSLRACAAPDRGQARERRDHVDAQEPATGT